MGDRQRFANELFDHHAEEVYRYVLGWTLERSSAVDLTTKVLRTAVDRRDQILEGGTAGPAELEMRLIALARAAATSWHAASGERGTVPVVPEESVPLFEALGQLDDNQREVLILCELVGHPSERVARLLGCGQPVVEELRHDASESLWRKLEGAPETAAVSTWDRLTVGAALRRAGAEWLGPADGTALAYIEEQLLGEAPVGVPASAPQRGVAVKPGSAPPRDQDARANRAEAVDGSGRPTAAAVKAAAAAAAAKAGAPAAAVLTPPSAPSAPSVPAPLERPTGSKAGAPPSPPGPSGPPRPPGTDSAAGPVVPAQSGAAAAVEGSGKPVPRSGPQPTSPATQATNGANGANGDGQVAEGIEEDRKGPRERALALVALVMRERWKALGIAALGAAVLGVMAALTIGGAIGSTPPCGNGVGCLVPTTLGGVAGGVAPPMRTDRSGNTIPTTTTGGTGSASGFPVYTGRGTTTTTTGPDGAVTTTVRGPSTTAKPPKTTTGGPTPTTAPPTTAPPTTAPPTTAPPTTAEPTTT